MTTEDEHHLRSIILELQKQILELRARDLALRSILQELSENNPEVASVASKYDEFYKEAKQRVMIAVEDGAGPAFGAEMDQD